MFSTQTELHDLKAENERLKDQIHQLQYLVAAAKLEITGKEVMAEQANAKITELQQAATTLQQLEELLREERDVILNQQDDGYRVFFDDRGKGKFRIRETLVRDTIPAAIAAVWERRGE